MIKHSMYFYNGKGVVCYTDTMVVNMILIHQPVGWYTSYLFQMLWCSFNKHSNVQKHNLPLHSLVLQISTQKYQIGLVCKRNLNLPLQWTDISIKMKIKECLFL